jgi:hypothetical protein
MGIERLKKIATIQHDRLVAPMERASDTRTAAAKPHGWVHAIPGMGGARPSTYEVKNLKTLFRKP